MDDKKLNMIMTVLKIVLVVVGVIASLLVILGPNGNAEVEARDEFLDSFSLALAINYTLYIVLGGAAIILLFFVVGLVTNTKKTALSIVGILVALVLFLILMGVGSSDTNETLALSEKIALPADEMEGTIGAVTAGIYTAFIGLIVGALVWILSPLMGRLRK
jgi:hypothetical protein